MGGPNGEQGEGEEADGERAVAGGGSEAWRAALFAACALGGEGHGGMCRYRGRG